MQPNGEFMEFDYGERRYGVRAQEPVADAPAIHLRLENVVLDLDERARAARMDPRIAVRGTALDLALEKRKMARTVQQVWGLMIERGLVTPEDELKRMTEGNGNAATTDG